jgi:hypothetical protein
MAELTTHTGGCHCGSVRYEVKADLGHVISCNCSICQKRGLLLTFVPPEQFKLLSGEDALADYQFAKKKVHHLFCRHCGVESFARGSKPDGTPVIALNVRCFDDMDLTTLSPTPIDGKSF